MHLERIEAYGFKSFADRLCLSFNDGVTCIVGPNGCGKSNISDAIRWVLGEQRASDMRTGRGNKMDEVIFKGTNSRKPMAYCEVSLIFDNSDGFLKTGTERVSISRKMWKNGESQYFINGQKDRLKNLIGLLRDTGIGRDGYSVIGQGKIQSLLDAKPIERRVVFEEAAGIAKYRANRNKALDNLQKTQANVDVIAERMTGYEMRIKPLEKQAATAIRAEEIKARVKALDVNHFIYMTENGAAERKKLQAELDEARARLDETQSELGETNAEYESISDRISGLNDDEAATHEAILRLSRAEIEKDGAKRQLNSDIKSLESALAEKSDELRKKSEELETLESERAQSASDLERIQVESKAAKAEEGAARDERARLSAELERKRKLIENANSVIFDAMSESLGIAGERVRLEAERKGLEDKSREISEARGSKAAERAETTRNIAETHARLKSANAERAEKSEARAALDESYSAKVAEAAALKKSVEDAKSEIMLNKERLRLLEQSKDSYARYDSAVKSLMTSGDSEILGMILGVVGDVVSVPQKFALAIETALGASINNMITRDRRDAGRLIDRLVELRGGRGTFMPLDAMQPREFDRRYDDALESDGCFGLAADLVKCDRTFRPAIDVLLGRIAVVEDKATAARLAEKHRNAFRIVTLGGENYAVSGAISGGRARSGGSGLLSLDAQIGECEAKISDLGAKLERLEAESKTVDAEAKGMRDSIDVLDNMLYRLDKESASIGQELEYEEKNKNAQDAEISELESSLAALKAEIERKDALIAAEKLREGAQTDKRTTADDALESMRAEVAGLEEKLGEANSRLTEATSLVRALDEKGAGLASACAKLKKESDGLRGETANIRASIGIKKADLGRKRPELEKLLLERSGNAELLANRARLEAITKEKAECATRQTVLYKSVQDCSEKVRSATERKTRAETKLEALNKDIGDATARALDEYGLDYESALPYRLDGYSDQSGAQETRNLKRALAGLGDVNERAVEDLAELRKEYDAENLHYRDLLDSIETTKKIIATLTEKMERDFQECFDKINANFATVYKEMFDGGRGELKLDRRDGASVLDAGIIVEAEPSGKRLRNTNLLSGGEKALTAIAIIFAIIKLNPVPFCVLDEVDAPLDDSNAFIYANYLKKFSANTQFVIISHRKPTMELANEIYGVTMQEKGVSKIFSVKLADAVKMAEEP